MKKELMPAWIPPEAWKGYSDMRLKKKKPLTEGAKRRSIGTLERLMQEGEDLTLVLNQSEDGGYTGLFPVSASYAKQRGVALKKSTPGILNNLLDRSWAEQ
jgi:hypothetical protein